MHSMSASATATPGGDTAKTSTEGGRVLSATSRVALIVLAAVGIAAATKAPPTYEVYAVRYATLPGFKVSSLIRGADTSRRLDIAMMVWVVKGGGRTILVDSGFQ